MKTKTDKLKLVPFTEPLAIDLDKLPLFGVHVRDRNAHTWNPSTGWHKGLAAKLGKKFSLRNVGENLLIIRIK